jgi:transcriptional regulator GlxA family with amidase domain
VRVPVEIEQSVSNFPEVRHYLDHMTLHGALDEHPVARVSLIGDARVRRAIALIEARCHDPQLRQRTVAAYVEMADADFAAKFKNHTGVTFREYVRTLRLHRAASLLMSSRKSITEVWTAVGYNHPSNFNHDFKRRFEVTPTEYRAYGFSRAPCSSR